MFLPSDDLMLLPERRDIGRALTPGEKVRLLRAARLKPERANARLALTLVFNTTMRGREIKALQSRGISLMDKTLTIRHSKTEAGERVITLNADAMAPSWNYTNALKDSLGLTFRWTGTYSRLAGAGAKDRAESSNRKA